MVHAFELSNGGSSLLQDAVNGTAGMFSATRSFLELSERLTPALDARIKVARHLHDQLHSKILIPGVLRKDLANTGAKEWECLGLLMELLSLIRDARSGNPVALAQARNFFDIERTSFERLATTVGRLQLIGQLEAWLSVDEAQVSAEAAPASELQFEPDLFEEIEDDSDVVPLDGTLRQKAVRASLIHFRETVLISEFGEESRPFGLLRFSNLCKIVRALPEDKFALLNCLGSDGRKRTNPEQFRFIPEVLEIVRTAQLN